MQSRQVCLSGVEALALLPKVATGRVLFLDATTLLPGQSGDPTAEFTRARLPSAQRFDIDAFSDPTTPLPHMLPSPGDFARKIAALGVTEDMRLVFYDRQGSIGACRAWWLAKVFGHEDALVLDGGLAAFLAAGGVVETGAPEPPRPSAGYSVRMMYGLVAGAGDVQAALSAREVPVLDARSALRFRGEAPEPRPGVRGGHMAGGINLPYGTVLDAEGRFLEAGALRRIFRDVGADHADIITSCGSGLTAATLTVARVIAGLAPGRLYDGSWAEWGADPALPVVTG